MFPTGLPGLALLLLRASVAFAVVLESFGPRQSPLGWMQVLALAISAALSVGYLTPIAAVAALFCEALTWWSLGAGNAAVVIVVSLDAIALALLGPGAYSIDGYLFGRRVVVLPPSA